MQEISTTTSMFGISVCLDRPL